MRAFSRLLFGASALFLGFSAAHDAHAAHVSTFDVPNADATFPRAINAFGVVVGAYTIATTSHAFVRSPQGTITTFDAPAPGLGDLPDTLATGINAFGRIIGIVSARDAFLAHGYIRDPGGAFTTFDAAADALVTYANALNLQGSICGMYTTTQFVRRGYLRSPNGTITTFEVPGDLESVVEVTASDEVIGSFVDANNARRGFVWKSDDGLSIFDIRGAASGVGCTYCSDPLVSAGNLTGRATGHYADAGGLVHGFVRKATGALAPFDVPDATATLPSAINLEGDVVGKFLDSSGLVHGFLFDRNGTLSTFDVSSAASSMQVTGISLAGTIVGSFSDTNGLTHGFVRTR